MLLSPGRAERHGFEYFRHGTLSLYAAFNTKTGAVLGKTAERHTSAEFVAFLSDIAANQPRGGRRNPFSPARRARSVERGSMIITSNRALEEWYGLFFTAEVWTKHGLETQYVLFTMDLAAPRRWPPS